MSTTEDGVMSKYISKKGEGVHHLAFEVEDIDAAIAELKAKGVPLTSDEARPGAHGSKGGVSAPQGHPRRFDRAGASTPRGINS